MGHIVEHHFAAGLSRGLRTLLDHSQSSHRPSGSRCVPAHQSAQGTRFVQLSPEPLLLPVLTQVPDRSQKVWLGVAVDLMSRLTDIIRVLDNAVSKLSNTGTSSPRERHEERQTYLLMSSCKLFCMTAQAEIYMETSKLPIVPKGQTGKFRGLARDSIQDFFLIYKTFDREDDLRHLDFFLTVSRGTAHPPRFQWWLTIVQACWQKIRDLYLVLYPGDLDWFSLTEVSRQIILLETTLRVTPAGRNISVMHSIANMDNGALSPGEPNFLREDDRLAHGL
jgi:hypothetical protein